MVAMFSNAVMPRAGVCFPASQRQNVVLFLGKSDAPFQLCFKRSSFITSLVDSNAPPALDQDVDLQQVRNATSLVISVLPPPWNMVYN